MGVIPIFVLLFNIAIVFIETLLKGISDSILEISDVES